MEVIMLRRCDRYVLRQMMGPFLLALSGLILFILINIILSLSPLMVDRGIGIARLLRLMLFKMPALLVIAVPMAALFAAFLGLGRLSHDREIVALESLGISLRRILLPLLGAALLVSAVDFATYNWVVPASEEAYQRDYLGIVFSHGVPQISANKFFKGTDDQFFYIRRYDKATDTLYDVVIYDTTGQLFPQAQSRVTMITAEEGRWTGDAWTLSTGNVYGFDSSGLLIFSGHFEGLLIPLDQSVEEILFQSRTPAEMGISELRARIAQARATGQRIDKYVFEAHLKVALPLATVVFVLVGGAASLALSPRSRSAGIVVGLVLVSIFQGVMWYTQTLGVRGAINPALAAWLPNLIFGVIGLFLFVRVDRLASKDVWSRMRLRFPFLVLLALLGLPAFSQDVPLELTSDTLFISTDRKTVEAAGSVSISFGHTRLFSDSLSLIDTSDGRWTLTASGNVSLEADNDLAIASDSLVIDIDSADGSAEPREITATTFTGRSRMVNASGEEHQLYFLGEKVRITFDRAGKVTLIDATETEMTTCDCCGLPFRKQPYTLSASRLRLFPDRLVVASGLVARIAGVPSFWLPVYVQPLEETLQSPLFPAIGRSQLRGWFLKWNVPFFLAESVFGSLRFDYFNRFSELGVGLILRYVTDRLDGKLDAYVFPAKVGDRLVTLSLSQSLAIDEAWRVVAAFDYSATGNQQVWTFSGQTEGDIGEWRLAVSASRAWEDTLQRATERLPEISLSRAAIRVGAVTLTPRFTAGWAREWVSNELAASAIRVASGLDLEADPLAWAGFTVQPKAAANTRVYSGSDGFQGAYGLSVSVPANRDGLHLQYDASFGLGESPFGFDRLEDDQRLAWRIERSGRIDVQVTGGLDLSEGRPDPVHAIVQWRGVAAWICEAYYALDSASLEWIALRGDWRSKDCELRWTIPYNAEAERLEPITLSLFASAAGQRTLSLTTEFFEGGLSALTFASVLSQRTLSLTTEFSRGGLSALTLASVLSQRTLSLTTEFSSGELSMLTAAAELRSDSGWGAEAGGSYEPNQPYRIQDLRYGLFRDIGDCIRVGLERSGGNVWIYASILAFPDAVLRYAPETAGVKIGD